ncbi:MAG: FadR family transcriptional regulator [Acidimicrobiaceae bacterium]|jgi:GntR family transcriptional repressor for pyruvate dehydrogenase complex|nr:FadR family transcriptional regulator [Acidimicrobiaceae bacterium]
MSATPDEGTTPFPTLERTSIGLQAADAIKALILSGELRPGDALPSERDFSGMLGISRPSLREAIRALSVLNIVEPRHGGGTYVSSLEPQILAKPISFLLQVDEQALGHLFEVRRVLEAAAARLAAQRIGDEELADLDRLVQAAGRVVTKSEEYLRLDVELHRSIVEAADNPIYLALFQSVADLSTASLQRGTASTALRRAAQSQHQALVIALRDRDGAEAARIMEDHLEGTGRPLKTVPRAGRATAERRRAPPRRAQL